MPVQDITATDTHIGPLIAPQVESVNKNLARSTGDGPD